MSAVFIIRAVTLDHYMSKSITELYSENIYFNQSSLEPVIRIFGSTPEGEKSCVHVHGAFPYIYVPYRGGDNPQRDALILGAALDEALKSSTNQQNYRFIFKVSVVAGIPLYGYHGSARQFFKIFFYNPYYIRKASDLLLAGAILGQKLQPHEAHIPYILQFMIDYDIYGMSFVSFSKIKYRKNFERPESLNAVNRDDILPDKIKKITCSYFEVDALVTDIIQKDKTEMTTSNPGLRAIWEDEKIRRRNQEKSSQITIEKSQSRRGVKIDATEAMYKSILAQKLENIFRSNVNPAVDLNESQFSYPATLPENTNLEKTLVCEGEKYWPQDVEVDLDHIRSLIDEHVLNESKADTSEIGEEVEEAEADSVLGKDLKEGVEEEGDGEEVELEENNGGDMTQSLEALLNNSVSSSNGDQSQETSSRACEEEFWRKMAGKLFQFDGAQDTSSDTDTETTDETGIGNNLQEKHIPRDIPSFAQESLNNTLSSSLSENDLNQSDSVSLIDLPIDCSSYSPKIDSSWLPANDEPWNWDKTDIFADCFSSKNQTVGGGDLAVINGIKSSEGLTAKDLLENYFFSNPTDNFSENYTVLPPTISAGGNIKSICGNSCLSPSTLPSESTNFLYRGLNTSCDISDDICKSPPEGGNDSNGFVGPKKSETKTISKQSLKVTLAKDLKNLKQKISLEDSPRETNSLTLKEYLKDFGEIVNVDFKNFNDQEMVIVEYKPYPGKSNQNKFLIKPLNIFLENWNRAEKKINTTTISNKRETSHFRKGRASAAAAAAGEYFQEHDTVQKTDRRFSSSTSFASSFTNRNKTNIKATKNEYVLKATKISPENPELVKFCSRNDGGREEDVVSQKTRQRYSKKFLFKNLKKNLIKVGEISEDFSSFSNGEKDQNGNHISSCGSENFKNKMDSDEDSTSDVDVQGNLKFYNRKNKSKKSSVKNLFENRKFVKKKRVHEKSENISSGNWKENLEEKNIAELDFKLVEEINSCFENYFKNIIKINNCFNEKCRNLFLSRKNKSDYDSEISSNEEDYSGVSKNSTRNEFIAFCEKNPNVQKLFGSNSNSIKFIAQFLSAFSEMSRVAETPPLAITIKVGDRRNLMAPVHLNLKSRSKIADEKETETRSKKPRRKLKIESVDGPADSLSSDDSEGKDDLKNQLYFRKKIKGGKYYKSLNVVLCKSSGSEKIVEKRKRKSSECSSAFDDVFNSDDCSDKKKSRKKGNKSQGESTKKIKEQSESEKRRSDMTEFKNNSEGVEVAAAVGTRKKSEIIISRSSEQGKSVESGPETSTSRTVDELNVRIPQVDVDASSSSGEEEFSRTSVKKSTRRMKHRKSKIVIEKIIMDSRAPENLSGNETMSVGQSKDFQNNDNLENTFVENLDNILNKTCFKIPAKWSDTEESENDLQNVTLTECNRNLFPQSTSCSDNLRNYQNLSSIWTENSRCLADGEDMCKSLGGSFLPSERYSSPSSNCNSTHEREKDFSNDKALRKTSKEKSENNLKVKSCRDGKVVDGTSASSLKTFVSKVKPPSRKRVLEFLSKHENLKSCSDLPHYSNPRDVRKSLQTGPVILKVETNSVPGLKPYKSDLVEQEIEDRRNHFLSSQGQKFENVRSCLVANKRFTITPLRNPPFSSFVLKYLKADNKSSMVKKEEKTSKKKIYVPLSPGQDSHSDDEVDLSIAIGSLLENSRKFESDTPSSTESSQNIKKKLESTQNKSIADAKNLDKCTGAKKEKSEKCENLVVIAEELESSSHAKIATPVDESQSSGDSKILKASQEEGRTDGEPHCEAVIKNSNSSFGIRGVTLDDTFGFSHSVENFQKVKLYHMYQHITLLIIELHVETRKDLRPDPKFDSIKALFYTVTFDSPTRDQETGVIVVSNQTKLLNSHVVVHNVQNEIELIYKLVSLVKDWDPDILAGYEIEMNSWGYLVQRGFQLEINLLSLLARVQTESSPASDKYKDENDELELHDIPKYIRNLRVVGRIVLDIWRLLRHEMALTSYTFENVMYHVTQERHPLISFKALTDYWKEPSQKYICITAQYYISRVKGEIKILEQLDFLNRTSELARLFGIQFIEVLSRGSQFRVESMMLRLAKPLNYIPVSPSIKQRAEMRAPASLPLILEPESLFYADPVIVLDFQSLYPSMIIAYNYCFSTCLGRLEKLGSNEPFEFGCTQLQVSAKELKNMENDIHISPAGVAFVGSNIRKGVLPSMLEEILETRLMVKKSMKENKNEKLLLKVLHARQLGLKLIANVTYGYTAANFSGRMPCIEVGDSVVSKGRETLHRAIELIKSNPRWGARVVYGDTDSIFVLTPRKTREEAFEIGAEIADAVTQDNPKPVKLKLEKVYQPCILQTKKRYVGYMFESPDQKEPILEAKGIETVRRDGCPAVKKILQKALQILFDTKDVSLVKKYTIRQFVKLFENRVNLQDLIFAKEYRGRAGYRPGACVPALELARQRTRYDKRAEPRVKERVPYVIVNGLSGVPLIKLVRSPNDLLEDPSLRINAVYYITKAIIPPMHRCFSLLGVDVSSWYLEMPKKEFRRYNSAVFEDHKKRTISQYFSNVECILCPNMTTNPVCNACKEQPQVLTVGLTEKIRIWERRHDRIMKICKTCHGHPMEHLCQSFDCPILFRRIESSRNLEQIPILRDVLSELTDV